MEKERRKKLQHPDIEVRERAKIHTRRAHRKKEMEKKNEDFLLKKKSSMA